MKMKDASFKLEVFVPATGRDSLLCLQRVLGYIVAGDEAFFSCAHGPGFPPLPRPGWTDG